MKFLKSLHFDYELIYSSEYSPFVEMKINKKNIPDLVDSNLVLKLYLVEDIGAVSEVVDLGCLIEGICGGTTLPADEAPVETPDDYIYNEVPFDTINLDYAKSLGLSGGV
jgi:hypothetical protein